MRRIFALLVMVAMMPLFAAATASAKTSPEPAPPAYCPDQPGIWFSPWGEATVLWSPKVRELIKNYGAKVEAYAPVTTIVGPAGEQLGIHMPVGNKHDNIGLDGRICYPGGFSFTLGKAQFKLDDGFAVRILPCGITARPVLNGVRQKAESQLATCFAPEVLLSVAGFKDGGLGGGITPWHFNVSSQLAAMINGLLGETALKAGDPLFTLAPVLKFHPFRGVDGING